MLQHVQNHDPPCKFGTTLYSISNSYPECACIPAHSSNRIIGFELEEEKRLARGGVGGRQQNVPGTQTTRIVKRTVRCATRPIRVRRRPRDKTTPSWMHGLFLPTVRSCRYRGGRKIWTRIKIGWCPRRVLSWRLHCHLGDAKTDPYCKFQKDSRFCFT